MLLALWSHRSKTVFLQSWRLRIAYTEFSDHGAKYVLNASLDSYGVPDSRQDDGISQVIWLRGAFEHSFLVHTRSAECLSVVN
jgi:hypothetical protein